MLKLGEIICENVREIRATNQGACVERSTRYGMVLKKSLANIEKRPRLGLHLGA